MKLNLVTVMVLSLALLQYGEDSKNLLCKTAILIIITVLLHLCYTIY